jgi:hypothetical protein
MLLDKAREIVAEDRAGSEAKAVVARIPVLLEPPPEMIRVVGVAPA